MSPVKACHCLFAFAWLVGERLVGGLFSLSLDSEGVVLLVVLLWFAVWATNLVVGWLVFWIWWLCSFDKQ